MEKKTRIWRDTQRAMINGEEHILVIDNILEKDGNEYFEYVSLNGTELPKIDAAESNPIILDGEWETVESKRFFKYE